MNIDQFWTMVEESRKGFRRDRAEGNMDSQLEVLKGSLSRLSRQEVLAFRDTMDDLLVQAFTWELWGAAFLLGEGYCTEDWFLYFRAWLISLGRNVFEQAIRSPDSLAELGEDGSIEDIFFEQFLYVPNDVLGQVTGDIPKSRTVWPDAPTGTAWNARADDLKNMLPNLWQQNHDRLG